MAVARFRNLFENIIKVVKVVRRCLETRSLRDNAIENRNQRTIEIIIKQVKHRILFSFPSGFNLFSSKYCKVCQRAYVGLNI